MDDREAYEFYKDPEHLQVAGRGYRRKADRLTEIVSVRFSGRMLAAANAAAEAAGLPLGHWLRRLVGCELARLRRVERPSGLIPGSERRGAAKALPSSLGTCNRHGRTFACPHLSIGNVVSASCGICGPLRAVA